MATTSQPRLIFVNVPVKDLPASTAFFRALGFDFDEKFTDESCACMVVSEQAYVMLLAEARFADFTTKPIVDARASTEAILCVSAESREGSTPSPTPRWAPGPPTPTSPWTTGSCTAAASRTSTATSGRSCG